MNSRNVEKIYSFLKFMNYDYKKAAQGTISLYWDIEATIILHN